MTNRANQSKHSGKYSLVEYGTSTSDWPVSKSEWWTHIKDWSYHRDRSFRSVQKVQTENLYLAWMNSETVQQELITLYNHKVQLSPAVVETVLSCLNTIILCILVHMQGWNQDMTVCKGRQVLFNSSALGHDNSQKQSNKLEPRGATYSLHIVRTLSFSYALSF